MGSLNAAGARKDERPHLQGAAEMNGGSYAQHVLHYRSPVDGADLPYHVCAPEQPPTTPLPLIFLLHDTLREPSAEEFIEEAFRQAAAWLAAMVCVPPVVLVQPFGRGNAAWIGPAGRDLFDVWELLGAGFFYDDCQVTIVGSGAGATGALQLATWFPMKFAAVAAIGAWADDRLDLPLGSEDWPEWEKSQRKALSPRSLAVNLANLPVYLEHPWWIQGIGGSASPLHTASLVETLQRLEIPVEIGPPSPLPRLNRECPADRGGLLRWLLSHRRSPEPSSITFKTFSPRSFGGGWLRLERLQNPGRPGTVVARREGKRLQLQSRGVAALSLQTMADQQLYLDGQYAAPSAANGAWQSWERFSAGWQRIPSAWSAGGPFKTEKMGGPLFDLFWDGAVFVSGTLGDEAETAALRTFADGLRNRWRSGADSTNPHSGDRGVAAEFPRLDDFEFAGEMPNQRNLVVVGSPRTNLLLARWRTRLPIRWLDDGPPDVFAIREEEYADPLDAAFVVCPHPETAGRYVLVVAAATIAALSAADRVRTAFLPDYLVHRAERVLAWGYFDVDWA